MGPQETDYLCQSTYLYDLITVYQSWFMGITNLFTSARRNRNIIFYRCGSEA